MFNQKLKIANKDGEKLDVLIEGNTGSKETIVFVHGWGVDKDDGNGIFIDIAKSLGKKFRCVRFDMSSCGKSEGKEEDANHQKFTDDLKIILHYVREKFGVAISLVAISQGTLIASLAFSQIDNIYPRKVIFISPVNTNSTEGIERKMKKILSRGGTVDEFGISISPRSAGEPQKIGPGYWKALREMNPLDLVSKFSKATDMLMIRPIDDEYIDSSHIRDYQKIISLKFVEIHGGHNFKKPENRAILIEKIEKFLQ